MTSINAPMQEVGEAGDGADDDARARAAAEPRGAARAGARGRGHDAGDHAGGVRQQRDRVRAGLARPERVGVLHGRAGPRNAGRGRRAGCLVLIVPGRHFDTLNKRAKNNLLSLRRCFTSCSL